MRNPPVVVRVLRTAVKRSVLILLAPLGQTAAFWDPVSLAHICILFTSGSLVCMLLACSIMLKFHTLEPVDSTKQYYPATLYSMLVLLQIRQFGKVLPSLSLACRLKRHIRRKATSDTFSESKHWYVCPTH